MNFSYPDDKSLIQDNLKKLFKKYSEEKYLSKFNNNKFDINLLNDLRHNGYLFNLNKHLSQIDLDILTLSYVNEEIGYNCAPLDPTSFISDVLITVDESSWKNKDNFIAELINDKNYFCTSALQEPFNFDLDSPQTYGVQKRDGYIINGTKICIYNIELSKNIIVSFISNDGILLALIPTSSIDYVTTINTSSQPYSKILFKDYLIPFDTIINKSGEGLELLRDCNHRRILLQAAFAKGLTLRMIELTAQYTSEREQFGKPIGSFQAVAHRAADCYIENKILELHFQQAMYKYQLKQQCENEIYNLKYILGNALHNISYASQHLHGGMGVAKEYPLWRFCLAAKDLEISYGNSTSSLNRVGKNITLNQ